MRLVDSTPEDVWKEDRLPKVPDGSAPVLKCPKDKDTYILSQNGAFITLDRENALSLFKELADFLGVKVRV